MMLANYQTNLNANLTNTKDIKSFQPVDFIHIALSVDILNGTKIEFGLITSFRALIAFVL